MKRVRVFNYFITICIVSLILLVQASCTITMPTLKNITLYIYETDDKQMKLDIESFIKQKPDLILDRDAIRKVGLIQRSEDEFVLEIHLSELVSKEMKRITSANIGKRLVFVSDHQILFAPLIFEAIQQEKVVVELPSTKKASAEKLAEYFSTSFEFLDNRPHNNNKLDSELRKAYEHRDKGKYDEAIKAFEQLLMQEMEYNAKTALYNEIALSYRLKSDESSAAEAYRRLLSKPVNIDLNNYKVIAQAYFYLFQLEKGQHNIKVAEDYFDKGIATLDYIIKNFPVTKAAEWASIGIGTYELLRGNIKEAEKRAVMAKHGDFKGQGHLLLGLCYEYQKRFKEAKEEYKRLIKNFPDAEESKIAHDFIRNLDRNETNIEGFLNALGETRKK